MTRCNHQIDVVDPNKGAAGEIQSRKQGADEQRKKKRQNEEKERISRREKKVKGEGN